MRAAILLFIFGLIAAPAGGAAAQTVADSPGAPTAISADEGGSCLPCGGCARCGGARTFWVDQAFGDDRNAGLSQGKCPAHDQPGGRAHSGRRRLDRAPRHLLRNPGFPRSRQRGGKTGLDPLGAAGAGDHQRPLARSGTGPGRLVTGGATASTPRPTATPLWARRPGAFSSVTSRLPICSRTR